MPSGETTTGSLTDALPSIIAQARIIREDEGVWQRTTDVIRQKKGTGLDWQEFSLNQEQASDITETTRNQNFQQLSGQLLQLEPDMTQILIKITDRTFRKIAAVVSAKMGSLAQNAMERKKDEDYLALFSGFATTTSPGTGNPISFGHISAAVSNIESNVTEPSMGTISTILHGFQIYDIQAELVAGVGTYTIPNGLTEEVFRRGFRGTVSGSNVFKAGNISIDSTPDANGATHALEGVVAVMGMMRKPETDRDPYFGGGAGVIIMTDEYGYVERTSAGTQVWAQRHLSDATQPSS
jgi:hypothetical protein